jgi:AraC family transcriptional regulator
MDPTIENCTWKETDRKTNENVLLPTIKQDELWQSFMPRRREIINTKNQIFFHYRCTINSVERAIPIQEFDKWAAVEVTDFNSVPDGIGTFRIARWVICRISL